MTGSLGIKVANLACDRGAAALEQHVSACSISIELGHYRVYATFLEVCP